MNKKTDICFSNWSIYLSNKKTTLIFIEFTCLFNF